MGLNKKERRAEAKKSKAKTAIPAEPIDTADTTTTEPIVVDASEDDTPTPLPLTVNPTAPDDVVVPKPNASLPARQIKTVAGVGASSTFKGVGTMREHGIPAGLRRNEFQDRLLEWNENSQAHLSDDELAALMDREHPLGGVRIADRPELVATIRKFYNLGQHGKQQGGTPPTVQSLQYEKPVNRQTATAQADTAPTKKQQKAS